MTVLVCERKTSGESIGPGTPYWKRLIMDPQISLYIKAANSLGYETNEVLYDLLAKPLLEPLAATPEESRKYTKPTKNDPTPRLYANQRDRDETPEEFQERCLSAIVREPDRYYQRGTVVRLENEILEAEYDVWMTAGVIREARRLAVWPRNPDACVQWGRTCDYFAVCTGTARIDDPMIFQVRTKKHEELDGDDHLDLLTQSALRCYRACPRRYFYRYEELISLIKQKAKPLRIGSSVHKALEAWTKNDGSLTHAIAAIEIDGTPERNYEAAKERAMMIGYHARWSGESVRFFWVEKEFRITLRNPATGAASRTWILGGRLDSMAEVAA